MGRVKLEDLRKEYSDVVAVDGTNLDIEDGEFVTFVGPSGCGKTTSLEMVAGLTMPTSGSVFIGDRDVTDLPPKNRNIAMVFQNIALFPHLDVYDNISFGLQLRNYADEEIENRVQEAAEILQLEGMLDRMPDELSGGQRQRVAIGRAIVRNPDVFLMDEPLANLDAKLRKHMRTEVQRIQRELDVTAIYVTHNQEEAMTMSDRVVVMNDGAVQQFAPPMTCYKEPANEFVAGFIGSPAMNFVDATVAETGLQAPDFAIQRGDVDLPTGTDVRVGIRPEYIYPADTDEDVGTPTEPIDVTVDVVEPLGNDILVYLLFESDDGSATQAEQVQMIVDNESTIEEGEQMQVVIDVEHVHVFDVDTGDAVMHGLQPAARVDTDSEPAETDD